MHQKKKFKTKGIIEKCKVSSCVTFFNNIFLIKKGIWGMRVWVLARDCVGTCPRGLDWPDAKKKSKPQKKKKKEKL